MRILQLIQGSEEWSAARAKHFTASEASAMMGVSKKTTRGELLSMKATGSEREFSEWVQKNLLDKGHEIEAKARFFAEEMLGEELFPATATDDDGYLLASFDGLTMGEDVCWECKSWNKAKAADVRNGIVPAEDYWQVVQQLVVSGAEKCLYTVTDGTPENTVHAWMNLTQEDKKALLAGWSQFEQDLLGYEHAEVAPVAVGRAPETLPALRIEVTGMVTSSNLAEFKAHALAVFDGINTDLQTDEDFANADKTVKWCGEVEERLEAAKQHALSQTASIGELFRTVDAIKAEARAKRLELDRLVKGRKDAIRGEIMVNGRAAYDQHVAKLNERLGDVYFTHGTVQITNPDLAGVMRGKKSITSLRDAVATELARCKILANEVADRVEINLKHMEQHAEYKALFADLRNICFKDADDFKAIVSVRIAEYQAAEADKQEAAREKMRLEEEAKARAKVLAEQKAAPAMAAEPKNTPRGEAGMPAGARPTPAAPVVTAKSSRPSDRDIIRALSFDFEVDEMTVVLWLKEMDLSIEVAA